MNNIVHNLASPARRQTVSTGPYASLFQQVFGANVFTLPAQQVVNNLAQAVAAWESTTEVSPFASAYDAYLAGKAQLTPSQLNGLELFTGSTTGRPGGPAYTSAARGPSHTIPAVAAANSDLFTGFALPEHRCAQESEQPVLHHDQWKTNPLGFDPWAKTT